jgi:hypothetical protein
MIYLCSFRPLIEMPKGKKAVAKWNLPPFIDASCRREPDFESDCPSITALCRMSRFAPRLQEMDTIVYITRKSSYFNTSARHWRLVAILRVKKTLSSHSNAADWYRTRHLPVPSNCMVFGNPPVPLDKTDQFHDDLHRWDAIYRDRARRYGVFHICENIFRELNSPPLITEEMMKAIFGRIPGTRNPPAITNEQYERLLALCTRPSPMRSPQTTDRRD